MNDLKLVNASRIRQIIGMIDLTNLQELCNRAAIVKICHQAKTPAGNVAALCIWPAFILDAKDILGKNTPIKIATVVNFPSGSEPTATILTCIDKSLENGADEIDYVLPYIDVINGETDQVASSIKAVRRQIPNNKTLKVILETGVLESPELINIAATIAIDEGADFIKTSTGKVPVNATIEAADIMLDAIARLNKNVGFKAAGGVRTVEDANRYLSLADEKLGNSWADTQHFRFGASGLLHDALIRMNATSETEIESDY